MMKEDPHICARCAAQQQTCCQLDPGTESACFPLSLPEKERLNAAGYTDFWQQERTVPGFLNNLYSLFPGCRKRIHILFPLGEDHERLAVNAEGCCVFLADSGCLLPRAVRPLYCQLFPFWVVSGKITMLTDEHCLVARLGISKGLRAVGASADSLLSLYSRLVFDWGL